MMITYVTICLIIILILILIFYFLYYENILLNEKAIIFKNEIPSEIIDKFKVSNLILNHGDEKLNLLEYLNNDPFNPKQYKKIQLKDFINNEELKNNNIQKYQIKFSFNEIKNNNFGLYFDDLIKYCQKKFNNNNFNFYPYVFRMSKNNWSFPNHFDCTDQILCQLYGTRKIIVNFNNKDTTYNLEPGDILFLPVNKYHSVTQTNGNFNINFNLASNSEKSDSCSKEFDRIWKRQSIRCITNNCI
jgi:hypothetical protein